MTSVPGGAGVGDLLERHEHRDAVDEPRVGKRAPLVAVEIGDPGRACEFHVVASDECGDVEVGDVGWQGGRVGGEGLDLPGGVAVAVLDALVGLAALRPAERLLGEVGGVGGGLRIDGSALAVVVVDFGLAEPVELRGAEERLLGGIVLRTGGWRSQRCHSYQGGCDRGDPTDATTKRNVLHSIPPPRWRHHTVSRAEPIELSPVNRQLRVGVRGRRRSRCQTPRS